jgi:hypothetical protein
MAGSLNFINNYIYLYHTEEFLIIPTYPDVISDSMQSTFGSTNALSRSAPVFSFSNSGPRTVQINLSLHRDLLDEVNINISNLKIGEDVLTSVGGVANLNDDYLDTLIKRLQSIALPRYLVGSKTVVPPMVAIRFGDEIFIKGVVTGGVTVTYNKPIIVVNDRESKYSLVTVGFNVSEVDPYDADSVARLGGFRGLTTTNNIIRSN